MDAKLIANEGIHIRQKTPLLLEAAGIAGLVSMQQKGLNETVRLEEATGIITGRKLIVRKDIPTRLKTPANTEAAEIADCVIISGIGCEKHT